MSYELTVCELFAGVGGFRLGLEKAGWKTVWANQWEPKARKQHAFDCYVSHFGKENVSNEDISTIDANTIPDHTLLVGGFPCQDYSVATTNAQGMDGKKGVLWWDIVRILEAKRPPFILLENVDRLLKSPTHQRGKDFGMILKSLTELNYDVEWRVINAADYGFPQRRKRLFILGAQIDAAYTKYPITESFPATYHKPFEEYADLSMYDDMPNFHENYYGDGAALGTYVVTSNVGPGLAITSPVTLGSILQKDVDESYYLSEDSIDAWKYKKGAKKLIRTSKLGYDYNYSEGAISFPDALDKPARTLLTSEGSKSPNRCTHIIEDPETCRLRVLTPVECERLNGFPDDWTNTGMPLSKRYFCMGNALVVGLVTKIGKTLKANIK